ncbi:MAG: DUF1987 domain-containing protein [Bacteroidales bacterium]|nr:DUF1987 domain-containing protein [Bacteroidales bacterium]
MSQQLFIPATEDKPEVNLDPLQDKFEISGKSLPEDAKSFYDPIIEWFEEYTKEPNDLTVFNIRLNYFNSSSARKIVELLSVLEMIKEDGKEARIIWHYKSHDDIMRERGEEVKMVLDIPFDLESY